MKHEHVFKRTTPTLIRTRRNAIDEDPFDGGAALTAVPHRPGVCEARGQLEIASPRTVSGSLPPSSSTARR
jgi:hypothetical protein